MHAICTITYMPHAWLEIGVSAGWRAGGPRGGDICKCMCGQCTSRATAPCPLFVLDLQFLALDTAALLLELSGQQVQLHAAARADVPSSSDAHSCKVDAIPCGLLCFAEPITVNVSAFSTAANQAATLL